MALSAPAALVRAQDKIPEDYAYTPIYYKGLIIAPKLTARSLYNDNIYATSQNEKTDFIAVLQPELEIIKNYETASLSTNFAGSFERYKDNSNENRAGYSAALNYENDFNSQWTARLGASYNSQPRNRQDPTSLGASSKPLDIDTFSAQSSITRRFNRLSLTLKGQYDNITNEDGVSLVNPLLPIRFSPNDRDQYTGTATLQYDLVPGGDLGSQPEKALYLKTSLAHQDYEEQSATAPSRDRDTLNALLGFIGTFKSLNLLTDLSFGTTQQNFKEANIQSTRDLSYFAKIQYQPGEKHTLNFDASREVTADSLFIEGITETNFALASQYELQHNLYLNSRIAYEINEFETGREDKDTTGGLGLRYLLSPRLESTLGVTHTDRTSTDPSAAYDQTLFMLQLIGRL